LETEDRKKRGPDTFNKQYTNGSKQFEAPGSFLEEEEEMRTNGLRLEWMNPNDLKDNPLNFRKHSHLQDADLSDALDVVGWAGVLLLNERPGKLIDGHQRKRIAIKKGVKKVPVVVGSWTEEEERQVLLTFDAIGAMATADKSVLETLLASVSFESAAINSMLEELANRTDLEWARRDGELTEPADNVEQAQEFAKKWQTAPGQLWSIDRHRLICVDCTDPTTIARLLDGAERRIRLIPTDPPWATNYGAKTAWMEKRGAQRKRDDIANDSLKPEQIRKLFGTALKLTLPYAEPGTVLYAIVPSGSVLPHFIASLGDGGFTFKHALVWVKNSMVLGRSDYSYRHETILYAWVANGPHYFTSDRTQSSVFEIDRPAASPYHPTTKPIQLIAQLITNSSRKEDLVFDPFAGSGTTLLAGAQLERVVHAVEVDPTYVAVSLERLHTLGLRPKLMTV